jgi:Fe-S-cluster containining protein
MGAPDCQTCAACCFARGPEHVPLSGADHARLTEREQAERTVWRGNRCFMRVESGRCVNLALADGRFACAIYERRPAVCRDYRQGGEECAFDRERVYGASAGSP